jgi:hypothetical protein
MLAGLWFLILGFVFFILILKTLSNVRCYAKTHEALHLHKTAVLWLVPIIFVSALIFLSWSLSLSSVDRNKIIGNYEVDAQFYPGKNALWQKRHYRFQVRPDNTFVLFERLADSSEKMYVGNITWANEATEKWSISMENDHHIVPRHPILYRERFGFYYVFKTKKYGNMFFRKI